MRRKIKVAGKMRLSEFVENPDNPQTVTDRAFERLVQKLARVPGGLTAKRIAYVTDHPAGKFVVLSGNKRLRALKQIHGADAEVPAEWFQDVTAMTDDQRRQFVVTANVVEGTWVAELLVELFPREKLSSLMDDADVASILADLPREQMIAENVEIDSGVFEDEMTLKVRLSPSDRDKVVGVLRMIDADDMAAAFMTLVRAQIEKEVKK